MTKDKIMTRIFIGLFLLVLVSVVAATSTSATRNETIDTCADCHSYMSKRSQEIVAEWKESIHAKRGISCADCHGGNPNDPTMDGSMWNDPTYIGVPSKQDIPGLCAKCHSDPTFMRPYGVSSVSQFEEYKQSIHGKLLAQGDEKVATCVDCHDTHTIRPKDDVKSWVHRTNIPKTCATCHSDAEYMKPYNTLTNQYEEYKESLHGKKLLVHKDRAAPACSDCHGVHGATPPGVTEISQVCGNCHARIQDHFDSGPHAAVLKATGRPGCIDCHGYHGLAGAHDNMLLGAEPGHCGSCHGQGTKGYAQAQAIHKVITGLEKAHKEAIDLLHRAENADMDVKDQIAELEGAKTHLVAARSLQHSVTLSKVEEAATQAMEVIDSVSAAAGLALDKSERRSRALLMTGLFILFTAGVLYWKWRLTYERWLAQQKAGRSE